MGILGKADNLGDKRLESLDVLRGFDLFCLVGLEHFFHSLNGAIDSLWYKSFFMGILPCRLAWFFFVGFGDAAFHVYGGCVNSVCIIPL